MDQPDDLGVDLLMSGMAVLSVGAMGQAKIPTSGRKKVENPTTDVSLSIYLLQRVGIVQVGNESIETKQATNRLEFPGSIGVIGPA
ncbi:MAG: hypothetical protein ABSA81_01725 [Candidatus Bathyarchaeia archaeon]